MVSGDHFVGIDGLVGGLRRRAGGEWRGLVGFENIEAAELLVDNRKGLEAFRLEDLFVEPSLDFVLLEFGQFLVGVIEMSRQ